MEKSLTLYQRKDQALNWLSYASLLHNKKSITLEKISTEKSRLDRIISEEYVKAKKVIDYNQFCLDWIKDNGGDVIYSDKWLYDIPFSDEPYELNIDTIIDKLVRKKAGAKF
jgi:hypothetical protein